MHLRRPVTKVRKAFTWRTPYFINDTERTTYANEHSCHRLPPPYRWPSYLRAAFSNLNELRHVSLILPARISALSDWFTRQMASRHPVGNLVHRDRWLILGASLITVRIVLYL